MRVWREGDRIRNGPGTGYSDRVTDVQILSHLANGDPADHEYREFAYSVLALRELERRRAGAAGGETP